MSAAEFQRINRRGLIAVSQIGPTPDPLGPPDEQLMVELALGGMMQLEASRLALRKAVAPDVRLFAQAEVEEQTGLITKMREASALKHAPLPADLDRRSQAMLARLDSLSGPAFDRAYILESGIRGHQLLDATMARVEAQGHDRGMRILTAIAHPLVRTHLQVAQEEAAEMA